MKKLNKNIIWVLIVLAVVGGFYAISQGFSLLGSAACSNKIVDSLNAQNIPKKVVIFVTDCGATSGYGVHASILDVDKSIDNSSVGNIIGVNSNNGKAWPSPQGWPMVKAVWKDETTLTIYYAMNSEIFSQHSDIEGIHIEFVPITSQVIEQQGW